MLTSSNLSGSCLLIPCGGVVAWRCRRAGEDFARTVIFLFVVMAWRNSRLKLPIGGKVIVVADRSESCRVIRSSEKESSSLSTIHGPRGPTGRRCVRQQAVEAIAAARVRRVSRRRSVRIIPV